MTFQAGYIYTLSNRKGERKGEGELLNDNAPYDKSGDSVEG